MSRFVPIKVKKIGAQDLGRNYQYGFAKPTDDYVYKSPKGLSKKIIEEISAQKNEPVWMRRYRLEALKVFESKPVPTWGGDLSGIDWQDIHYYLRPIDSSKRKWSQVPKEIRDTFDKIGIPEAERKYLAGVSSQYDSQTVYDSLKKIWEKKGVVFLGMDEGLQKYPDLVKEYFGTVIPMGDNKLAALNWACWSGGSFIYVPKGVKVDMPLQAYFRINAEKAGQFERTLIIADEGSEVRYLEGCSSPSYSSASLHAAVVEIIVKKGARVQYTTVQNWWHDVYNLVTKRAWVEEEGQMEWVDFNMGCLSGETKIFIEGKGVQNIRDVQAGDMVFSVDLGHLLPVRAKVLAIRKTGTRRVYQLKTENARLIKATDNHPFLVLNQASVVRYPTLEWRQLKDIKIGDRVAIVRGLPDLGEPKRITFKYIKKGRAKFTKYNPVLPEETTEDVLWLLGVYQGDGYLERDSRGNPNRVYFAVPPGDRARKRLEKILLELSLPATPKGICVTVPSVIFAAWIQQLGFGGKARDKRVPDWVFDLPRKQKLAFIEGYLDSDGSLVHQKEKNGVLYGQITFASVNKALLEDMKLLMISAGLNPLNISTYEKFRTLYKGRWKYYTCHFLTLNIRGNLQRILDKEDQVCAVEFVRVWMKEDKGLEGVYDLEIKGSHNFVANGIVVHNSKLTMKYPSFILAGKGARGETLSMALAGRGQHQDTGSKAIHLAPYTTSTIMAKSISKDGGRTSYRGMVTVGPKAKGAKSKVVCDALILDPASRSDTYPTNRILCNDVSLEHEATVSKIGEDQLFYLMSRGLTEAGASQMIVSGFVEPLVKKLPLEYAVEMNRLIDMEMEGSVG